MTRPERNSFARDVSMGSDYLWGCRHILAKRVRHGLFAFNGNDLYIGRSLDKYGEWCEAELRLLQQLIRPGDVVLDVGANIGTHTVPLAGMVGEAGRVHAFEPQRITFQLLCANVAINGHTNVFCHQAGAGSRSGEIRLAPLPTVDTPSNFGAFGLREAAEGEVGRIVTIDSLDLPSCRLMKIDVEGMEADVIEGAAATIARFRPALFVENDRPGDISRKTNKAIFDAGYRAYWHISPYFDPGNFFREEENIFPGIISANLLCFHRESNVPVIGMVECSGPDDDCMQALKRAGG